MYSLNQFENLCSKKNLHKNIHSDFIYHHQKLKAINMPFSGWMSKQTVVPPCNGYHSELTRNELSSYKKHGMDFKCIVLSERSQSEKAGYMIPVFWHSRKGKTIEMVKRSGVARCWGEAGLRRLNKGCENTGQLQQSELPVLMCAC